MRRSAVRSLVSTRRPTSAGPPEPPTAPSSGDHRVAPFPHADVVVDVAELERLAAHFLDLGGPGRRGAGPGVLGWRVAPRVPATSPGHPARAAAHASRSGAAAARRTGLDLTTTDPAGSPLSS